MHMKHFVEHVACTHELTLGSILEQLQRDFTQAIRLAAAPAEREKERGGGVAGGGKGGCFSTSMSFVFP